ncbi:MAG: LCP family protein [Anaerolineales bacterium]
MNSVPSNGVGLACQPLLPPRLRRLLLPCLLLTLLAGCSDLAALQATPMMTVTLPAQPSATATPFAPQETQAAATALPPWQTALALQATPAATGLPAPAAPIPQPAGQVSILLLGSDQRPAGGSFRTDTIVLLSLRQGSLSLVGFPRDLYVYIPGWQMQRINTAYPHGGFELLADTLAYNFGVRPEYFVLTNLSGFKDIVDSLGGIEVEAARALTDQRDGYPRLYTVGPGTVHMDGETALWYVRARYSTSDYDRLRRAQEVLVAIGRKLLSLDGLNRAPELYALYRDSVETNLDLETVLRLLPLLQSIDLQNVERYEIGAEQVTPWMEPESGAQYLLPRPEAIQTILQQAVGIR